MPGELLLDSSTSGAQHGIRDNTSERLVLGRVAEREREGSDRPGPCPVREDVRRWIIPRDEIDRCYGGLQTVDLSVGIRIVRVGVPSPEYWPWSHIDTTATRHPSRIRRVRVLSSIPSPLTVRTVRMSNSVPKPSA